LPRFGRPDASSLFTAMPQDHGTKNEVLPKIFPVLPDDILFGQSAAMQQVHQAAAKISQTSLPVLLCGEGGTGKEALASWIHANSKFNSGEFVKVNCAAIPGPLLESELFGYERGAFTGANMGKPGRVESAHGGTLFLDEIADLDLRLQSKLLQFLQDGTFSRLGDAGERRVHTRVICACNKNLEAEIVAGRFRQDLYYRIQVFRLELPPLRERREDIPQLAEYFRLGFARQFGMASSKFPPGMLEYLQNLAWPGNVRELSNGVARYVLIGPDAAMHTELTGSQASGRRIASAEGQAPLMLKRLAKDAIRELEKSVILEALHANHWNRRKTAQALKISYRALIYKIRDAGLATKRESLRRAQADLQTHQAGAV
jgi:two-component system response regulator AtoC